MRNMIAIFLMLLSLAAASAAWARGGQDADDCPPGSTDPDCQGAAAQPAKAK